MPISDILLQFGRKMRRTDLVNADRSHSEWDRRLGRCSLTIIVAALVLAITLHLILPAIFSEYYGRKTEVLLATPLLSLAFTSALIMLSTVHLGSISRRIAKNGALYQLAHCTCGQAVAVAVAWAQLLDQIGLIGAVCRALSDHINLLFHNAFLPLRLPVSPSFWHGPPPPSAADDCVVLLDLLAAVLPLCAAMVMLCSVRVLITSSTIFLIATLFTSASTTTVALLHNVAKLGVNGHGEKRAANEAPFSMDELFLSVRWWLLAWPCIELLSFLAEECSTGPRRALPRIMRAASRVQPALALLALLAFFPFIRDDHDASAQRPSRASVAVASAHAAQPLPMVPLPAMFNSIRLFSARYLMNVGSVCALWAALLSLFLAPTRLLATLAMDRMAFPFGQKHLAKIAKKGGQPRFAVIFVALCCALISAIVPQKLLCRLIPLNCVLRMVLQALLVYVCHFTPSCSDRFLGDCGKTSQKYRRVRPRATRRRRSVVAQSPATDQKLCAEEEEEEDYGEEEDEEDNSADSEDEAWFRECREREQLLERIWRMAAESAETAEDSQSTKGIGTPLLELNNPPTKQQQKHQCTTTYQSIIQNGPPPAVRRHSACHLPRPPNGGHHHHQHRHNCFRSPCTTTTAVTAMTVNGRTVHTAVVPSSAVPFPGPHVYEADALLAAGWLEAGGAVTRRVESGTKAAATRDEHAACGAAQRALLLACSAAAVCAAAHTALRNASADYLPLFPLLTLVSAIGTVCSVIVWLCRLRVDYGSGTSDHQQHPLNGKLLPIGAVLSVFILGQLFPLFPATEWAFVFGWTFIGLTLHALALTRLGSN